MTLGVLSEQGGSLANLAATGQAVRFTEQYLRRYADAFDRVVYFSYADEAAPPGARWTLVPNRRRWHRWAYACLLPFVHAREFRDCDVLRVMQLTGEVPALIARWVYGTPFVATYGYDYARNAGAEGAGRLRQRLFRMRTAIALRRAARVIVTSDATAKALAGRVPPGRIVLVPNGVDLTRFVPASVAANAHDPARILFVGRLSPEKNLDLLVDAVAALPRRCELRLIGDGPERERISRHAAARQVAVDWRGVVAHEQLPDHFAWADLFVLPSRFEGHPKSLIEAMACGCVCVGTRVPGIEGIITDGATGLLAETTAESLQRAMEQGLGEPELRRRVSVAAAEYARANFDLDRLLQREIEMLQAVASQGRYPC